MTGGLEVLPSVAADEFYEITRGYARLNGLAATSGHKIEIETSVDGDSLMKIPAAFFNTDNNTIFLEKTTPATTGLHFGEGITLLSTTNMSFPSGTTTLSLQLVYRIIKI